MLEYRSRFPEAELIDNSVRKKMSQASIGKKQSKETKRKKSRALKGQKRKPLSEEHKRAISKKLRGRKKSEEHKYRISESHKAIQHPWLKKLRKERIIKECPFCGAENEYVPNEARVSKGFCSLGCWYDYIREDPSRHHNWKSGLSQSPYNPEFNSYLKQEIRERDEYTCQLCGKSESENASDGRVLAVHHIDFDKDNCLPENLVALCTACNAKVNYDREYWKTYFQNWIKEK